MTTDYKTERHDCTICRKTGRKSKCCGANVTYEGVMTGYSCNHCKKKCKTETCKICKGKGYVNLKVN